MLVLVEGGDQRTLRKIRGARREKTTKLKKYMTPGRNGSQATLKLLLMLLCEAVLPAHTQVSETTICYPHNPLRPKLENG